MKRVSWLTLLLVGVIVLAACGGAPTASSSANLGASATETPTVNPIPTQTRIAELSLIATLTAPTPTRVATPGGANTEAQSSVGRLDRSNAFVPADNFGADSILRAIYEWPEFAPFIQAALGEQHFYPLR